MDYNGYSTYCLIGLHFMLSNIDEFSRITMWLMVDVMWKIRRILIALEGFLSLLIGYNNT